MRITKKLDLLLQFSPQEKNIFSSEQELNRFFGENITEQILETSFFPYDSFLFFEERNVLYYIKINFELGRSEYSLSMIGQNLYGKVDDALLTKLAEEKRKVDKKTAILQDVMSHPSLQLKNLFRS